ncbi:hypothetical protein BDZ45DRAFT_745565 [Acephala macrosclerotiorum]|nr:hypothetical protein BDZ45DRAFT_745565 [Acephala macrosclerotiorum]
MSELNTKIDKLFSETTAFERQFALPRRKMGEGTETGGGNGQRETQVNNGLTTPAATPEVDQGRIDAEKARAAAAAAASTDEQNLPEEQENPENNEGEEGQQGDDDEDDDDEDDDYHPPEDREVTKEQREAVQHVMSCKETKQNRKMLRIEPTASYVTPQEEAKEILKNFLMMGMLTHDKFNSDPQAEEAFRRVLKAARILKVAPDHIREINNWDGETEFPGLLDEEPMEEDQEPQPTDKPPTQFVQKIYDEATQHLQKLWAGEQVGLATKALFDLNDQIKQQNKRDNIPEDQWTINIPWFDSNFDIARPYYLRLLNRPEGQSVDEEARSRFNEIAVKMRDENKQRWYRKDWEISLPTEGEIKQAQQAKADADAAAAATAKATEEAAAKAKADEDAAATAKAAEEAAAKAKADEDAATVAKAAAEAAAKAKADANAAAAAAGKIQYPWTTHILPDGREIVAGRQHSRRGKLDGKSTLVIASDQSRDPLVVVKAGVEVNVDESEVEKYFNMPGIHLLAEKKKDGSKEKTWTWMDDDDDFELVWVAVGERKTATFGKNSKAAEGQCCIWLKKKLYLCTRSDLTNIRKAKRADRCIEEYCKRKGITPPWDVKPKTTMIATEILEKIGLGGSSPAGQIAAASGWTAINRPAGGSEVQSLQNQMDSLEKKVDKLQFNPGGTALESALAKLEARMASIEGKVGKIDQVEVATQSLTQTVNNLATTVDGLLDKLKGLKL